MTATTHICGYDADSITLRGKDLVNDVIGHYSFTAAFLLQALGKEPSPEQVKLIDLVLVTIMEHGLVPSAVASRLTLHGAPESFQGAVAAGLLGVGDRYAGTAGKCGELLSQIMGQADIGAAAAQAVADARSRKQPIPGFGHPIHKGRDPRVDRLVEHLPADAPALQAAFAIEQALTESLGKPLVMNVSAAMAAVMAHARIPANMMRGVVLVARCAGLVGHVVEEMSKPIGNDLWQGAEHAITYEE